MAGNNPITNAEGAPTGKSKERTMPELSDEKLKAAMKEAFREAASSFLDEKFAQFGKWSLRGICAAFLVAVTYFILMMNGWHK